jgi:hypothetical protein
MDAHTITLGRSGHSPGHCHNCAQVSAVITVPATSRGEAVKTLQAALAGVDELTATLGGFKITIQIDSQMITTRTVKIVTVPLAVADKADEEAA